MFSERGTLPGSATSPTQLMKLYLIFLVFCLFIVTIQGIVFTVKVNKSNSFNFKAETNVTIKTLKNKIHELWRVHVSDFNLFFEGEMLYDYATLDDCGVKDKSVITLILTTKGG